MIARCCLLSLVCLVVVQRARADTAGTLLRLIQTDDDKLGLQCPQDANRVVELYREINSIIARSETGTTTVNAKGKEVAYRFKQKLRSHIVRKNGNELATYMNGPDTRSIQYREFVANLLKNYEKPVISAIFSHAMEEIGPFKTPQVLALFLWHIYKLHLFDDKTIYAVMVEQQLSLYQQFKRRGKRNNIYIFNLSYYMYKIKTDPFYKELSNDIRQEVEDTINQLPMILKRFFFSSFYCLENNKHHEDLYTGESDQRWDQYRRRIYSWSDKTWIDSNGYFKHAIHESSLGTNLHLKFIIRGTKFGLIMFMANSIADHANVIAAWEATNVPKGSEWSVELGDGDDHLILSQDGYLMCNSERFDSPLRRFLYGFRDGEHTKKSPECQWILNDCKRYSGIPKRYSYLQLNPLNVY